MTILQDLSGYAFCSLSYVRFPSQGDQSHTIFSRIDIYVVGGEMATMASINSVSLISEAAFGCGMRLFHPIYISVLSNSS